MGIRSKRPAPGLTCITTNLSFTSPIMLDAFLEDLAAKEQVGLTLLASYLSDIKLSEHEFHACGWLTGLAKSAVSNKIPTVSMVADLFRPERATVSYSDMVVDPYCIAYERSPFVHIGLVFTCTKGVATRTIEAEDLSGMYIFVDQEKCKQWWSLYRTVPNAQIISNLMMSYSAAVIMHVKCSPDVSPATLANWTDMSDWVAARERHPVIFNALTTDVLLPVIAPGPDTPGVCINTVTAAVLPWEEATTVFQPCPGDPTAKGGLLVGEPCSGKFSAIISHAANDRLSGGPVCGTFSSHEPLSLTCAGTLVVVPAASAAWRVKQVEQAYAGAKIVKLLSVADVAKAVWADVLAADVVITTVTVLVNKAYRSHARTVVSHLACSPDKVHMMFDALLATSLAGSRRRTVKKARLSVASSEVAAFWDQDHEGGTSATDDLPVEVFYNMVSCAAFQLAKLPLMDTRCLKFPVLEMIAFSRLVLAEINSVNMEQLEVAGNLQGAIRWITDSQHKGTTTDQHLFWESVLPAPIRMLPNYNGRWHMVDAMTARVSRPPVVPPTVVQDVLPMSVVDRLQQRPMDADDAGVRMHMLKSTRHTSVQFLSPEECIVAVMMGSETEFVRNVLSQQDAAAAQAGQLLIGLAGMGLQDVVRAAVAARGGSPNLHMAAENDGDSTEDTEDTAATDPTTDTESSTDTDDANTDDEDDDDDEDDEDDEEDDDSDEDTETKDDLSPSVAAQVSRHVRTQVQLVRRVQEQLTVSINSLPCNVCFGAMCNSMLTCGHSFCVDCILDWIETNATCPLCMKACPNVGPILVPTSDMTPVPVPPFCTDEVLACQVRGMWDTHVCSTDGGARMSVVAFWLTYHCLAAQVRGEQAVIVVRNKKQCLDVAAFFKSKLVAHGVWPVVAYTSKHTAEDDATFLTGGCHAVTTVKYVRAGCRIAGVSTVLEMVPVCEDDRLAVAARLSSCTPGAPALVMRSCALQPENAAVSL